LAPAAGLEPATYWL